MFYLDEEVVTPAGDEVYYTNHQIHAKQIKIRELRSVIHSLEHDIEDGFEKEFCVCLDTNVLLKVSGVSGIYIIYCHLSLTYLKNKLY